jgi:protein-S-isoprenylcysteine O-methyltransferase Ste14
MILRRGRAREPPDVGRRRRSPVRGGLATLFGMRTWQHRRRTGFSGFNGLGGRDRWAKAAGLSFVAAVALGLIAPVLTVAGMVPIIGNSLQPQLPLIGVVVAAAGMILAWAAQSGMGTSWRIGVNPQEETALVTTGLFAWVRNPIFTAMIIAQAGTVLMAPSWLSLLGLAGLVLACELQVRWVEEPYLRAVHGPQYTANLAGVGRFVPLLGRQRSGRQPSAVTVVRDG